MKKSSSQPTEQCPLSYPQARHRSASIVPPPSNSRTTAPQLPLLSLQATTATNIPAAPTNPFLSSSSSSSYINPSRHGRCVCVDSGSRGRASDASGPASGDERLLRASLLLRVSFSGEPPVFRSSACGHGCGPAARHALLPRAPLPSGSLCKAIGPPTPSPAHLAPLLFPHCGTGQSCCLPSSAAPHPRGAGNPTAIPRGHGSSAGELAPAVRSRPSSLQHRPL